MKRRRIIWSERAAADLTALKHKIALDKPGAAISFVLKVKSGVARIARFPLSGRMVLELAREDTREIVIGNYRVVYKITPTAISIVTVFPARQLLLM